MKRVSYRFAAVVIITALVIWAPALRAQEAATSSPVASSSDLRNLIDQKNSELQQIQAKRDALEAQLEEVSKSKQTLSSTVKSLNYQISQMDLLIKSSKVNTEKLALEINSLNQNISQAGNDIEKRKETIAQLLVELQKRDHENLLYLVLKEGNLSGSLDSAGSLVTLTGALTKNISELRVLQGSLAEKIQEEHQKKSAQEMEQSNLKNRQYILQDQQSEKNDLLARTKNQERLYQKQIDELDAQQSDISKVIGDIEDKLRAGFDPSLLPTKRPGVLEFPVASPILTQYYGPTKFAERAYRTQFHTGVDFSASVGTPIYAAADGMVWRTDNNDKGTSRWKKYQYGRYILLKHGDNLSTLYAHLSRAVVKNGDIVKAGDLIGYSGNTGYATGPHLHFGVYWSASMEFKAIPPAAGLVPLGVTIDPMGYLPNENVVSIKGSR